MSVFETKDCQSYPEKIWNKGLPKQTRKKLVLLMLEVGAFNCFPYAKALYEQRQDRWLFSRWMGYESGHCQGSRRVPV